jgi:hypothetical protein
MDRVVNPPGAVVAPEMVSVVRRVYAKRGKTNRHVAPLAMAKMEGKLLWRNPENPGLVTALALRYSSKASLGRTKRIQRASSLPVARLGHHLCFREVGTSHHKGELASRRMLPSTTQIISAQCPGFLDLWRGFCVIGHFLTPPGHPETSRDRFSGDHIRLARARYSFCRSSKSTFLNLSCARKFKPDCSRNRRKPGSLA